MEISGTGIFAVPSAEVAEVGAADIFWAVACWKRNKHKKTGKILFIGFLL
jgi:hypothetical protein